MPKEKIGLIAICLSILIVIPFGCRRNDKKESDFGFLRSFNVPIYNGKIDFQEYYDKNAKRKTVTYTVSLRYPSKDILFFYDLELSKIGFSLYSPNTAKKLREWITYQTDIIKEATSNAQLDAFWINEKDGLIAWLALFYDWRSGSKEDTEKQGVFLAIKAFGKGKIGEDFNAFEYFSDYSRPIISPPSAKRRSMLEGDYSLADVPFEFRQIDSMQKLKNELSSPLKIPDLDGQYYFVDHDSLLTNKEVEKIEIKRYSHTPLKENGNEEKGKIDARENDLYELYIIVFHLRKGCKKSTMINKGDEIGLIHNNRILWAALALENENVYKNPVISIGKEEIVKQIIARLQLSKR